MNRFPVSHGALALLLLGFTRLFAEENSMTTARANENEQRIDGILKQMTLEEKIDMIGGYKDFYIRANARLGIPQIRMADGPLGVRNYGDATAFPAQIGVTAT